MCLVWVCYNFLVLLGVAIAVSVEAKQKSDSSTGTSKSARNTITPRRFAFILVSSMTSLIMAVPLYYQIILQFPYLVTKRSPSYSQTKST